MAKIEYICSSCKNYTSGKWFGKCPRCNEYDTAVENHKTSARAKEAVPSGSVPAAAFTTLGTVDSMKHKRVSTGIAELDRVLGGGLVRGSYIIISGEPGAGKTTMASEAAINLIKINAKVAYVSGEESESQAKLRFERLGASPDVLNKLPISTETSVERVCEAIMQSDYDLVIVDSIQTMISEGKPGAPGSIGQVTECGYKLQQAAKKSGTSVLLVGQVTKGGDMAGPRILEHTVDTVLSFEGDRKEQFRVLRAIKNRFGSTDEIGVFEMTSEGLKGIEDPSKLFVNDRDKTLAGAATAVIMEGTRPMLCEIQALVAPSNIPMPVRSANGIDPKRAQMLIAVMSRKAGYSLGSMDIFINVAGGLKVNEPAADLAVCLAIASAYESKPVLDKLCAIGEVSLLGEVRPAMQSERRKKEAERLGYTPIETDRSFKNILSGALSGERQEESLLDD